MICFPAKLSGGLTSNEWGTQTGAGDPDLVATNIRLDAVIFGVTGTVRQTLIPKTGQTNSYHTGDDGDLQKGVPLPIPRFTIGTGTNGTNLVTDNMTGLTWTRNANNMWGQTNWYAAMTNCNDLDYGGYTDWRLPNVRELYSLWCLFGTNRPLPNTDGTGPWVENDPFTDVQWGYTWTSTQYGSSTGSACTVSIGGVAVIGRDRTAGFNYYVWPVRGP